MLDRDAISRTGLPTWVPGRETKAEGWVNAAAKNSAAVHGIVNPNTVDKILSSESIAKTGLPTEVSGKGREAAGWVSEGAKNSAAVHGIVNPNVVDAILVDIRPIYERRESVYARGWTGMHGRSHASHMTTDSILY